MKVANQKHGTLTEADFLALAAILVKAGYTVRRGRARPEGNPKAAQKPYVEYEEG